MTTLAEFASNFPGYAVPPELAKLLAFQDEHGFEGYAECFGLLVDNQAGLKSWSKDEQFLSRLMPFAQATGGGSFYALWSDGQATATSDMPVVVFGDDGGVHVVAENVRGLLQVLTYGVEPMVDFDRVSYYKSKDFEPPDAANEYQSWLETELGLPAVSDADAVVALAQKRYKAAFDTWFKGFVKS
jgi:hypothetical protein